MCVCVCACVRGSGVCVRQGMYPTASAGMDRQQSLHERLRAALRQPRTGAAMTRALRCIGYRLLHCVSHAVHQQYRRRFRADRLHECSTGRQPQWNVELACEHTHTLCRMRQQRVCMRVHVIVERGEQQRDRV